MAKAKTSNLVPGEVYSYKEFGSKYNAAPARLERIWAIAGTHDDGTPFAANFRAEITVLPTHEVREVYADTLRRSWANQLPMQRGYLKAHKSA